MTPDSPALLSLDGVRFGFPEGPGSPIKGPCGQTAERFCLGPVTVTIERGQCWAIIGPNGAGKSTLLRLMAGLFRPHAGCIALDGQALADMSPRERARRLAFLPQHPPTDFDLPVRDLVLMGRFPHRSLGLFESAEDYRIATRAMEITQTTCFANRPIATLSGGEAQRVHVAAAIAQEPRLLLLDEPTASLDIQHELAIFHILRDRAARDGLAVVMVTHDINLAARFCSHVLLLGHGNVVASGAPARVLTPEVLGPVYGVELTTLDVPDDPGRRWLVPIRPMPGGEP